MDELASQRASERSNKRRNDTGHTTPPRSAFYRLLPWHLHTAFWFSIGAEICLPSGWKRLASCMRVKKEQKRKERESSSVIGQSIERSIYCTFADRTGSEQNQLGPSIVLCVRTYIRACLPQPPFSTTMYLVFLLSLFFRLPSFSRTSLLSLGRHHSRGGDPLALLTPHVHIYISIYTYVYLQIVDAMGSELGWNGME